MKLHLWAPGVRKQHQVKVAVEQNHFMECFEMSSELRLVGQCLQVPDAAHYVQVHHHLDRYGGKKHAY